MLGLPLSDFFEVGKFGSMDQSIPEALTWLKAPFQVDSFFILDL